MPEKWAKNVSNVTKLTGQMNCLHINSDLRFVSNVFLQRKKLLRRGHYVAEGTVDIFHCSPPLINTENG